jgi:hypothetical protein
MSMTHSARKVWLILRDNGIDLPYDITVERTYAGRNLKADGWAVWLARRPNKFIICGGSGAIKKLRRSEAEVFHIGSEMWVENR